MKRFLIVKTSSLGDIVHSWPVAGYLQERFPGAQIDWVVESRCKDLVATHPAVTRTLCFDMRRWRKGIFSREIWHEISTFRQELQAVTYDAVFDLQRNSKSALMTFLAKAKAKVGFGRRTVKEWPNLLATGYHINPPEDQNIHETYLSIAKEFFGDKVPFQPVYPLLRTTLEQQIQVEEILKSPALAGKERVMICPGSAWKNKQPNEAALLEFLKLRHAAKPCAYLFVWGAPHEQKLAEALKQQFPEDAIVVERLAFPTLQHVMNRMDLVVAMDSLALHLAGTTSAKTYGLFGPSLGKKFMPLGEGHQIFQGTCPYGKTFETQCPLMRSCPTGACLRDVSGDKLFKALNRETH